MPYSNRGGNDGDGNSRSWRLILFFKIFYFKRRWFVFTSDVVAVVFFIRILSFFLSFVFSVCNWISIPFYWRCLYYRVFNVSLEVWLFIVISFYFVSLEFFFILFLMIRFRWLPIDSVQNGFFSLSVCMSELLIINARAIKFMPI